MKIRLCRNVRYPRDGSWFSLRVYDAGLKSARQLDDGHSVGNIFSESISFKKLKNSSLFECLLETWTKMGDEKAHTTALMERT